MSWQQSQHPLIYRKNCDWTLILRNQKSRQDRTTAAPKKQGPYTTDDTVSPLFSSIHQLQQYQSVSSSDLPLKQPCHAQCLSSDKEVKPWILVTSDTDTFRTLAKTQIMTRHVFEIGCSTGGTSAIVWNLEHVQTWIGFDTSADMVENVREKLKSYTHHHKRQTRRCIQINPLLDPQLAAYIVYADCTSGQTYTANVQTDEKCEPLTVILDIGGNREAAAVILMLQWILTMFPNSCRQIIIKSQTIHAALFELSKRRDSEDVNEWFQCQQIQAMRASVPKHPLQAAKKFAMDNSEDQNGRRLICRYHNYHEKGCKKFQDKATVCPLDHEHCHLCCQHGHIARNCPCIQ